MTNNLMLEPAQPSPKRSAQDRLGDLQPRTNLTALQSEFWIGQKLHPDVPLFNCIDTFTIRGVIKPDHFQAAFQKLIDKTDALRTIFHEVGGIPWQRVVGELPHTVEYLDFSQEATPYASFQDWMKQRSRALIDIEQRPFDSALIRISADQFIWYLALHHIVADGSTFHLMLRRMEALYRCSLEGRLNEPITFPLFEDYIEGERISQSSPRYLADQSYWEKMLGDTQPLTFYGRHPAKRSAVVRRINCELGPERTRALKSLAQQDQFAGKTLNISLFNMLAGVFAAYLYKISGNEHFSLGTPFSNRSSSVLKQTAGLLMGVVPFRVTIAKDDTFTSLIRRLQAESAEMARHCGYHLTNQQNTLYDVIFNFRSGSPTSFHGMPVQENVVRSGTDRYTFSLHVRYPETRNLVLQFDFHPDVFDEALQTRAIEHFLRVLDAFLETPDQRIDRVGLLSVTEKERVTKEFNETNIVFPADACIQRLFEAQVERSPDAVAVEFSPTGKTDHESEQLTYCELNRKANRLAHHLGSLGVGPEVLVGICMERSVEMVIGLFGILKAGGAYVPLDPDYPQERLACMLEDAGISVLLTQQSMAKRLPAHGAKVVCLDAEWPAIALQSDQNPAVQVSPENLAYVIFTSGSTGRPKGAMNTHRGICNRLLWMQQAYHLEAADRVLQKTPFSFDVSVWEFFWPLMTGACLVVAVPGGHKDSDYLATVIAEQKITTIHFVPSMLQAFLDEGNLGSCGSLKRVICSGEALPVQLQDRFFVRLNAELHNLYGPTEAAVDVTFWACKAEPSLNSVPIGRPIANTQIYLLDSFLQPVPIGVTGELYIGGIGLGRGYASHSDLTAEKFIPNPFSDHPGERLYKTGDLARYRQDGSIEFLGRIDHQVKIRGFRIELGEIETVLRQHVAVREAVVVVRGDSPEEKRLVTYVVTHDSVEIGALCNFVKTKLPDYMVPSSWAVLDSLPLGPNGKIDRRALPPVNSVKVEPEASYIEPRTATERILAAIWAEAFKCDRVGVRDNFFDLGGHSLTALQVASRIRDAFQTDLNLRAIFDKPTIAGLAETVDTACSKGDEAEFSASMLPGESLSRPLSFAQQRLWFLDQLEPGTPLYNISEGFRLRGRIDIGALENSVNEIVRRHEALRTTFSSVDGTGVQLISPAQRITLPVVDLSNGPQSDAEREARRLVREEAERPFDLARGPLLGATVLRLGDEDHVLLVKMHHIVSDGWSMAIFLRELTALYNAFAMGQPSPLTELTVQYSDYAQWQHRSLTEKTLATQVGYWKNQLAGVATLELRTDHPRPALQSTCGDQQMVVLPRELTSALKRLSQRQHATLFMVLLAGFKALLHQYSGQRDIAVGVPIAGRNRLEFEHLIGFFVNTLVLRTQVNPECTFAELVSHVGEVCLSAYSHQDLPFEKLVEELKPDRDLSRNPLFQVLFQVRNLPSATLQLSDVTSEEFALDRRIAKFDLAVDITEIAGELSCVFNYNTDLFEPSSIQKMQRDYSYLLERVVAQPDGRIGEIILPIQLEESQVRIKRNDRKEFVFQSQCTHRLFEQQSARTPDATAVVFENERLNYGELNSRANQLAHQLKNQGIGPEVLVGLYLERSVEMIVALLATLKAGGAYVPLDPEYPQERLDFIIEDARPGVVLTQQRLSHRLDRSRTRIIALDTAWNDLAHESAENLLNEPNRENLAYVIYTSGSTGRPKGVLVEHGQLMNYCRGVIERLQPATGSSFAMVQPLMFDSSVTMIFVSLLTGGALHVISKQRSLDPNALADYFQTRLIDFLKITPSHLASLHSGSSPAQIMPRRCLILGGEESRLEWVENLQRLSRECAIFNHYGPTETAVGVVMYRIGGEEECASVVAKTPIGRPIAGTEVYLLDQNLEPVSVGVVGELYVGGQSVTRGYLNSPDLSAQRFIPDPFSERTASRLYKTGDLARYLTDGNIEFLGRADEQVKVRGFRVEPGEVEMALKQHPDVREAVVLARDDGSGQKRLIAYVVPTPDRAPTIAGKPRYKLPNGMAVAQLNKNETDYLYQEIFERQAYLRHGITVKHGDCIFDVGANIGLFMLFADQLANKLKIYAFEPNPAVFEILSANASSCVADVKLYNCGLSDIAKTAAFTHFPGFSLLSGFYADAQKEKALVKTYMLNQQKAGLSEMGELLEQAEEILDERFRPRSFAVQLKTVSAIMEDEGIQCIDLLKVNVEKSELDVLNGIKASDWDKIKQIVLEVDSEENLAVIASLLEAHEFEFIVDQDPVLTGTPLHYIYAIRASAERSLLAKQQDGAHLRRLPARTDRPLSIGELRLFAREKLPDYMIPSEFVLLDALPLAPNGKLDRQALPTPDSTASGLQSSFAAPRTTNEKRLAEIWAQVLNVRDIDIHSNFFDLGGHSLLAIQLVSRIRDALRIELPLRSLFEHPTVAELSECIAPLRKEEDAESVSSIVPEDVSEGYPLSFAQERFWFLNQLDPNNPAYKVSYGFRLQGRLDIDALDRSLCEIVRRHETLRTTIQLRDGRPLQVVQSRWSFSLSRIDLTGEMADDLDAEIQRRYEEECQRPFDLSKDLLLRATLLRFGADKYALFLNSHHISWDHWCIEVFFHELAALYRAYSSGKPSPLPEPAIQYKDYARRQRESLKGATLKNRLSYWQRQLKGAPPTLNLPADYPRKTLKDRRGARRSVVLASALSEQLKALSREAGASLFMAFLAAFQTLLHRLTGQNDIVVGTPVAGRDRSETEGLIGLFLNSLALRTDLSGNPTFRELLARVREVALGAYEHQDLPFEKVVEELQPERDLTRTPLFQVFINMYNFKETRLDLDQLSIRPIKALSYAPQFDLEFFIREHDDGIHLIFAYDSDLFAASTVDRMLGNFQVLLQAIGSQPERTLSDLPILTDAERQQLLLEWNDTRRDYPIDRCVHELFEEQAGTTPEATAAVCEGQRLTYRELNGRANQLGQYLRKHGVGPEVLVGVCVQRSLEMVVALLGILKAGGAYVPLDPSYPKERLEFILEDSGAAVLLTEERWVSGLAEHKAKVIDLDTERAAIAQESDENFSSGVRADQLIYVIYTSGSTGQPKGVMISHRAISNHMLWMQEQFPLTEKDRVIQKTPFSFDPSVWELFAPLLTGAQLVIAPPGAHREPAHLVKLIAEKKITIFQVVPSLLKALVEEKEIEDCGCLRHVFCGGEALSSELSERFLGRLPVDLWNLYGPTEASIDATFWRCGRQSNERTLPIGRPIANTEIYLLDAHLEPVPTAVPGEIHIGGSGLARGYWNRPVLTAENFIPNPFSDQPGARLYKTGDLARHLPDGNIEFLGRMDDQVKIRGFRIELGEIESVLGRHPDVLEAVVLAREDSPGEKRLVGYVVTPADVDLGALRNFAKMKLPEYMVPGAFVLLDSMPLTANGKIDRKALPPPGQARPELETLFIGPRTPVEKTLADIWAAVLKLERVGIHDNFFDLGGHSLLATQLISRLRLAFQLEIPLRLVFEMPTVAAFAESIETLRWTPARLPPGEARTKKREVGQI